MKIAIVGATGPTGQLVVAEALGRGHDVVAYVRRPEALTSRPNLTIIGGTLEDRNSLANTMRGCDVVISTLGSRSWRERSFMTQHLPLVTEAMQLADIKRLVLMSALGGGEVPVNSRGFNRLIFALLSRTIFADRTKSEKALDSVGLHWSAVYPGFLTDGPAEQLQVADLSQVIRVSQERIPRANVAQVLVDLAEGNYSNHTRLAIAKTIQTQGVNNV